MSQLWVCRVSTVLALACAGLRTTVAITLPTMWASSMVIQRGLPSEIWGLDAAGARITVLWRGANLTSPPADANGRFAVTLPAAPATTTPASMTLTSSAGGSVTLDDILVGDVFVRRHAASGSSCPPAPALAGALQRDPGRP